MADMRDSDGRETFSALLCLSNDLAQLATAATTALSPALKIEMLTPSAHRHLLTPPAPPQTPTLSRGPPSARPPPPGAPPPATPPTHPLAPGGSLETVVSHEVNEMGTHALECTVSYGVRGVGEDGVARVLGRSFRKVSLPSSWSSNVAAARSERGEGRDGTER